MDGVNFDLKEEIRDYWSKRSETFDLAFGHKIAPGPEADAWQKPIRDTLGPEPRRVLELACGTGEVTRRDLESCIAPECPGARLRK